MTGACELDSLKTGEQQRRAYWHAHGTNQSGELVTVLKLEVHVPHPAGEMGDGAERCLWEDTQVGSENKWELRKFVVVFVPTGVCAISALQGQCLLEEGLGGFTELPTGRRTTLEKGFLELVFQKLMFLFFFFLNREALRAAFSHLANVKHL